MLRSMKLNSLNPHITCVLCGGYLVDATTIIECLHSFCRSCIVRYLETSFHCPVCDVEIHKTRPLLHIKPDRVLQDIVYKLVPGLCSEGKTDRKNLQGKKGENKTDEEPNDNEEQSTLDGTNGASEEISNENGCPDVIDDPVCIQLEYYGWKRFQRTEKQIFPIRYLRCSSKITVGILKKFLSIKFGIPTTHQTEIVRSDEILDNHITMTELSRIYGLYAKSFLDIQYIFLPNKEDDELKTEGQEAKRVKIDHLQQYRHNELQQLQRKRKRRQRKHQTKEEEQFNVQPKQLKRRMKNVVAKERQEQDSKEGNSLPNGVTAEDVLQEKRIFCQQMAQRLVNDSSEPEKNDEHHQLEQQPDHQHVNQREQERDKETTTENQTKELQYEKEQQQNTPEDRLSVMVKQHVDHGCYQNRTEQTNVQQTQKQQSKENETRQHESVRDKTKFYQLNKHIVSAKNSTETESNKDKESLETIKISPHPLRSRNLGNTAASCAETFVCPPFWNGIEPTAI